MSVDFQASLLEALDPGSAAGGTGPAGDGAPRLGALDGHAGVLRHRLTAGAWVDVRPGWVTDADGLFASLVRDVPWKAERRQMYDRVVDVPRLLKFYDASEPLPHDALAQARDRLSRHYAGELGEPFTTAGLCYYRDGRDSVTWHGDRIGRSNTQDTMVAIVSLGDARRLSLRPRPGYATGSAVSFLVGHGDLLVMGGSCQRTWEHAILKSSRPVGPRVSIQFRPHNVR